MFYQLFWYGLMSVIFINIASFCYNLVKSLGRARHTKTEKELEIIMIPPLTGTLSEITPNQEKLLKRASVLLLCVSFLFLGIHLVSKK